MPVIIHGNDRDGHAVVVLLQCPHFMGILYAMPACLKVLGQQFLNRALIGKQHIGPG